MGSKLGRTRCCCCCCCLQPHRHPPAAGPEANLPSVRPSLSACPCAGDGVWDGSAGHVNPIDPVVTSRHRASSLAGVGARARPPAKSPRGPRPPKEGPAQPSLVGRLCVCKPMLESMGTTGRHIAQDKGESLEMLLAEARECQRMNSNNWGGGRGRGEQHSRNGGRRRRTCGGGWNGASKGCVSLGLIDRGRPRARALWVDVQNKEGKTRGTQTQRANKPRERYDEDTMSEYKAPGSSRRIGFGNRDWLKCIGLTPSFSIHPPPILGCMQAGVASWA